MALTFYRLLACGMLLAALAGCNRASYSFASQPPYTTYTTGLALAAPAAMPPSVVTQPARPAFASVGEAAKHHKRRHSQAGQAVAWPIAQPGQAVASTTSPSSTLPRLPTRLAAHRHSNAATSGALVQASSFDGIAAILFLYALLFFALLGVAVYALVKLSLRFMNHAPRKSAAPAQP